MKFTEFVKEMASALSMFSSTEAGHICWSFGLLCMGAGFYVLKIPKSEDIIVAGLTLIGRAMMGSPAAKPQLEKEA